MDDALPNDVFTVLCCPVCKDYYEKPQTLPKCGHTLCETCIGGILIRQNQTTNLVCPDCQTVNIIDESPQHDLPVNVQLRKLVWTVRLSEPKKCSLTWDYNDTCHHWPLLNKSRTSTCEHCNGKFCNACLLRHSELVRMETLLIGSEIVERKESAAKWLQENVENLVNTIGDKVKAAECDIEKSCASLQKALTDAIEARKIQMFEQVRKIGAEQSSLVRQIAALGESDCHDETADFSAKFDFFKESSILHCSANEITDFHKKAIAIDKEVAKLETLQKFAPDGKFVHSTDTAFHPEKIAKIVAQLRNEGTTVSWQIGDGVESKLPFEISNLAKAVEDGDLAQFRALLDKFPPTCVRQAIEYRYPDGATLVSKAAKFGRLEIIRYLVSEHGANFNLFEADDYEGSLPIHIAAQYGHLNVVKYLIELAPELATVEDGLHYTPLHRAAEAGETGVVRFFINELKCDANRRGQLGWTPLHLAAKYGTPGAVACLVEEGGADLSLLDDVYEASPLQLAISFMNFDVVDYLIKKWPELILQTNDNGESAIHFAASSNNVDVLAILLAKQAQFIEAKDECGNTPLVCAIEGSFLNVYGDKKGNLDVVRFLIERGANLSVRIESGDGKEETPIHLAAVSEYVECMEMMLEKQPNLIHLRNSRGLTPLVAAKMAKSEKSVLFLEAKLAQSRS